MIKIEVNAGLPLMFYVQMISVSVNLAFNKPDSQRLDRISVKNQTSFTLTDGKIHKILALLKVTVILIKKHSFY